MPPFSAQLYLGDRHSIEDPILGDHFEDKYGRYKSSEHEDIDKGEYY